MYKANDYCSECHFIHTIKHMSGFELNKIIASILLASLIAMLVGFVANILYKPKLKSERGYTIVTHGDTTSVSGIPNDNESPIDIKQLMANANSELGKELAKKCISCHTFNKDGQPKIGPNLWNIVDLNKASNEGPNTNYKFSAALTKLGGKWDIESLYHFLNKPIKYAPGTKMSFIGLEKPQDIANLIAYLQTLKD